MRPARGYVLALACEDAPRFFDAVGLALSRVQSELGAALRTLDLVYTPPLRLVCVLHLTPTREDEHVLTRLQELAAAGHMRVLDPEGRMPSERETALRDAEEHLSVRELGIQALAPALERFRQFVVREPATPGTAEPAGEVLPLSLTYATGDQFLARYSRNSLFVESEAVLHVGQRCRVSVSTGTGQGPIALSARVVHTVDLRTASMTNARAGYGLAFLLPPDERDPFESFLIALERGTPWPDRSGRRHERFAVRLRVVYRLDGDTRREYTDNLSRGGLFINGFDPPPAGAELELSLFAPGRSQPVDLRGRVTHAISAEEAAARGTHSGAGVVFTEDPAQVRAKVATLLAADAPPEGRRVLVADDDRFFRTVIGNAMRNGGFEVVEAADGTAASRRLLEDEAPVDAIVIDLYMPGLTGAELLAELRRREATARLPVVVVTGATLSDLDRTSLLRLGADDVVDKKLSPEIMLERVAGAMARGHRTA